MPLTVSVSGASGFVGRNVCFELASNGLKVIALVRSKTKIKELVHSNIRQKIVNIFDHGAISSAIRQSSVFFHFVGTSKKTTGQSYEKINEESTFAALHACKTAGVKKFVYLSGLGVLPKNNQAYFRSKRLAEQEIKKSGINYAIFRPSYIVGKQSNFLDLIVLQAKKGKIFIPGTGNYRLAPVYVKDFAQICASIVREKNKNSENKTFDLVGPQVVSFKAFCRQVCKTIDIKPVFEFVPLEKAIQQAMRSDNPVYSVGELVVLVSDTFSSYKPLEKNFAIKLLSLNQMLQESLL